MFDAAFQVYRRAFWQFALIQAIVAVPVALVQTFALHDTVSTGAAVSLAVVERTLPWSLVTGLLGLVQAAAVGALTHRAANGDGLEVGASYMTTLRRLGPLLGFGVVAAVIVAALSIVFVIPGFVAFIYLAPGLFLSTLWGEGGLSSIGASYRLVQGYFWRISGVLVMAGLIVFVINLLVSLLVTAVTHASATLIIVTTLLSILLGSFPIVALYLAVADLRRRKGIAPAD